MNRKSKKRLEMAEKLNKNLKDENTWYWDLKPDWKFGEKVEIKL